MGRRWMMMAGSVAGFFLGVASGFGAVLEVGAGQAYETIASAYTAAGNGDVINIHAGTYSNDLVLSANDGKADITFQAHTSDTGQYDKVVVHNDTYTYMRYNGGFSFDGLIFTSESSHAVYMRTGFHNATFTNTIFYGSRLYAYGGDGNIYGITIENATFFGAGTSGLARANTTTGWAVKDSLFIDNTLYGASGGSHATSIESSAFFGNGTAAVDGTEFTLGTGSTTDVAPVFVSTDISDPYFMYLDASTPLSILTGDSDGSFKGARGGLVPEPASLMVLGGLGLLVAGRPRRQRC